MTVDEMRSCIWKLVVGFRRYGLIHLLAQIMFPGLGPQRDNIFGDFMILLKAAYDSEWDEVLYVKIGGRVQELWFDMFFRPKWPK